MSDKVNNPFWTEFRELLKKDSVPESLYLELMNQAQTRAISSYEEFYYLLGRYPFLDLQHPDGAESIEQRTPNLIKAKTGWDIHDYGDRILTSPGRLMYGAYRVSNDDEDGGEGGEIVRGSPGTIVQQFVDTANEVIALLIHRGWVAAQVHSGFYGMIRAAWIAADSQNFTLNGFDPTVNDQVIYAWVTRILPDKLKAIPGLTPSR